eukprot:4570159-Ditylum_brightwellii.AAC.1
MARQDTSHIPTDRTLQYLPRDQNATEEYVTENIQQSPTSATSHKSKQEKNVQQEATRSTENNNTINATSEQKIAVNKSDKWEIESLAMDDDGWEDTWEQPPPISHMNPKTQFLVPVHTRAEELREMITADQFWRQVINNQTEKEKPTKQPYPDLLTHESNGEPPFIEYTENEWNKVLTHQQLNPTSPPLSATNPIIPPADRVSST